MHFIFFLWDRVFLLGLLISDIFLFVHSIIWSYLAHFPAQKKNKQYSPWKKILIFQEMELSSSIIFKKFFYFGKWNPALSGLNHQNFSLKNILYFFLKKPTLKKILIFYQKKAFPIFPEMELCTFHPKFWK